MPAFHKSPASCEWALKQEIPIGAPELRAVGEREYMAGSADGESGNALTLPLSGREEHRAECRSAPGVTGVGIRLRGWWMVLLLCCTGHALDCFRGPSAVPLLKHLVTEFIPFLNLTHMLFAEKKDKW